MKVEPLDHWANLKQFHFRNFEFLQYSLTSKFLRSESESYGVPLWCFLKARKWDIEMVETALESSQSVLFVWVLWEETNVIGVVSTLPILWRSSIVLNANKSNHGFAHDHEQYNHGLPPTSATVVLLENKPNHGFPLTKFNAWVG